SRAKIDVAGLGQVEVGPDSRVRLVETQPSAHRLALAKGEVSAHITAPPRIFLVDTPSAVAVDLGCAYTLRVDPSGNSVLHVTTGRVALDTNGVETLVTAGAICETRRGLGTGTPYMADAQPSLRAALTSFDFENGGSTALEKALAQADQHDILTVWNL